jgi:hypothetical protein
MNRIHLTSHLEEKNTLLTNLGQARGKMDGARGWRRGSGDGGIGRMRNGARCPRVRRSARRAMRRTASTSSAVALKSAQKLVVAPLIGPINHLLKHVNGRRFGAGSFQRQTQSMMRRLKRSDNQQQIALLPIEVLAPTLQLRALDAQRLHLCGCITLTIMIKIFSGFANYCWKCIVLHFSVLFFKASFCMSDP